MKVENVNPKILVLSEYLGLEENETLDIIEESSTWFIYNSEDYLILTSDEVDIELDILTDNEISYYQTRIDNESFEYSYFYKVNEEAIRDSINLASIGTGAWEEIDEYYIFRI
jgi:hypothetical protein